MKFIILILTLTAKVIAYEQVYAITAGEDALVDSDGIRYQERNSDDFVAIWNKLNFENNTAELDKDIYKTYYRLPEKQPVTKLEFNITLKSDGIYVLIAKFSFAWFKDRCSQNMTLNDKIQLLPSFDVFQQCGGFGKICDVYMYFCVKDKKLYYKNKWSSIANGQISVGLHREKGFASMAALVLLKGTLEERHTLKNSITKEPLFFDPKKMNPTCSIPQEKVTGSPTSGDKSLFEGVYAAIAEIKDAQNKLQRSIQTHIQDQSVEHKVINEKITSLEVDQAAIKVDIVNLNSALTEMTKILDTIHTSLMIRPR
jgi:Malectin domain